ncbi:MAG TPA: delta-60 repeat domain-containing protein [Tepidisphaeraceae bacterium]|nr:delta-60 repeat domain-containing protein [Tepidisphaeraceae bacterium]
MSFCAPMGSGHVVESLESRRMLWAGVPDVGFSQDGYVDSDLAYTKFVEAVGGDKVVLIGTDAADNTVIERRTGSGALDPTFDGDGRKTLANYQPNYASLVQSDGKVIVAVMTSPNADGFLARFNTDGSLDGTFGVSGIAPSMFGTNSTIALTQQPDGKLLALGSEVTQQAGALRIFLQHPGDQRATGGSGCVAKQQDPRGGQSAGFDRKLRLDRLSPERRRLDRYDARVQRLGVFQPGQRPLRRAG